MWNLGACHPDLRRGLWARWLSCHWQKSLLPYRAPEQLLLSKKKVNSVAWKEQCCSTSLFINVKMFGRETKNKSHFLLLDLLNWWRGSVHPLWSCHSGLCLDGCWRQHVQPYKITNMTVCETAGLKWQLFKTSSSIRHNVQPGDPIFDIVQQALRHKRVFIQVHQMRRLNKINHFKPFWPLKYII